jgi:hypothetical protein
MFYIAQTKIEKNLKKNFENIHDEYDLNCLTGRCVCLRSNQIMRRSGIKRKFKSILPGIYEIICRKNEFQLV